jgi:Nicotinamide phosphoribosyltransferase, N-terminal domain
MRFPCFPGCRHRSCLCRAESTKQVASRALDMASSMAHFEEIPPTVLSDSYKASHFRQYPECRFMSAYGEFRCGYDKDVDDQRMVHWGFRHLVESVLLRQWTEEDLRKAKSFYATHGVGASEYPWAEDLFEKIVTEHNGYFPVRVQVWLAPLNIALVGPRTWPPNCALMFIAPPLP